MNTKRETALQLGIAVALMLSGIGWMELGRRFFPNFAISKGYSPAASLPIWTFGMYVVMVGIAILIPMLWPSLGNWFGRNQLAVAGVAIVAIVAWLVICAYAGFLPT